MQDSFVPSAAQLALSTLFESHTFALDQALYWIAKDEGASGAGCTNGSNNLHDPSDLISQLDQLARQIHLPDPTDILDAICRINHHLFFTLGFCGDTEDYYHPHNSQIHKVLERKRGLPILLGVLYIEVARRLGIQVQGIGFPRHFLIRPTDALRPFYIDPFDKGNILTEEDLLAWHEHWGIEQPFDDCVLPSSPQCIVLRMCHNLFYAHNRLQNFEGMLRSIERIMTLQPNLTELHRTRSVVLGRMHRYTESKDALELYMLYNPEAKDISECQRDVAILKQLAKNS